MRLLKPSTAYNLPVKMYDSNDHLTGKTGLTLTITASKNGGAFNSISPTVTERTEGWYQVALTTSHTDTEGDLIVRCTAAGADETEAVSQVSALLTNVDAIVALLDAARGEPGQGAPPVNPDMATKVDYLYKWARNKKDNNGTESKYYADDGTTVDHKQSTAESGGTVTIGEMATGA